MLFKNWMKKMTQKAYTGAKYLQIRGMPVHYTDIGAGDVILHVHGSPAGADIGPVFFGELSKHYRIITPSRPGFLGTPLEQGKSIEEQADFLNAFLDALNIEKAFVHAWSAGGPPAISFAIKYPQRVKGYIHYCAVGHRWDHKISWFEHMLLKDPTIWLMDTLSRCFVKSFRKKIAKELGVDYDYVMKDDRRIQLLDEFFQMTAPPSLRNAGSFNDISNYRQMTPLNYKKMTVPALILFSESDNQLPVSNGDVPAAQIKHAHYLKFTHGGHMPMIDRDADLVMETMLDFMEKNNASN